MVQIGQNLLGTPYVGQTLEVSDTVESCVVQWDGLDCVTFFETCLGFARMIKLGGTAPSDLAKQITLTRYRGGILDGYVSRLHYTSEWISDNAKKGTVDDITPQLAGSVRFDKKINFMSSKPELYRQLNANRSLVPLIAKIEEKITTMPMFHVPRDRIEKIEGQLRSGDIVGITTSIDGIDCSHTGICAMGTRGSCLFMHASSSAKKVVLGPRLSEYVRSGAKNLGVMIARPREPISP